MQKQKTKEQQVKQICINECDYTPTKDDVAYMLFNCFTFDDVIEYIGSKGNK